MVIPKGMNEKELVKIVQERIASRYRTTLVHKNLASLPSFAAALENQFGYVPVLNEIDMILQRRAGELCAVEAKCFRLRKGGSFSRPFYSGIGQALSLLRYGFDYVALWHFFVGDVDMKRLNRYGAGAWTFVRNELRLPLEFTYFKVEGSASDPLLCAMQYSAADKGFKLLPLDHPRFAISWKNPNPFRHAGEVVLLRERLIEALGIET